MNRVIEWSRDGITIEADQVCVWEKLKDLGLERAKHCATPCAAERINEGNARSDESEGISTVSAVAVELIFISWYGW